MAIRQYGAWGVMALTTAWLFVPFEASTDVLRIMTTDGCGQILHPEALSLIRLLVSFLRWSLAVALFIELVAPKARWSAWALVSIPVVGFLVASSAVALLNADFLTACDIFGLTPFDTASVNILSVVGVAFVSLKRIK